MGKSQNRLIVFLLDIIVWSLSVPGWDTLNCRRVYSGLSWKSKILHIVNTKDIPFVAPLVALHHGR